MNNDVSGTILLRAARFAGFASAQRAKQDFLRTLEGLGT
jgi:hypothetical protein